MPVATNATNCNSVQADPNANPQRLRPAVCAGPCAWVVSGSHASVRPVGKKNNQTGRWRGRNPARTQIVPVHEIRDRLMTRFGDVRYWIESRTHSPDEIALRFHHRLVFIHPFSNGNGRHARLIADVLITKVGRSSFTWVLPISSKKAEHARDIWKRSERRMMATSSRFSSSPARSRSALLRSVLSISGLPVTRSSVRIVSNSND